MVLKESRPYLNVLAKLAPELNEATDRYMEELKIIESELSSLGIGIEVEGGKIYETAEFEEPAHWNNEKPVRYCFASYLTYERMLTGKWGLTIRRYRVMDQTESGDWPLPIKLESTPLFQASRDMRLAAEEHIPDLLQKITEAVQAKVARLDKAVDH